MSISAPYNPHAEYWHNGEINWPTSGIPFTLPHCVSNPSITYTDVSLSLTTDEVRSGTWSYEGWVTHIADAEYYAGVSYVSNHIYKAIEQEFNIHNQRIINPDIIFTIQPNPTSSTNRVMLTTTKNLQTTCYFELYNQQGNLIFKDEFRGQQYEFTSPLVPGIYLAKLIANNKMSYQKVLVSH